MSSITPLSLDCDQKRAVALAQSEKVLVITGGPGTGKTFTVNHILDLLEYEGVALAAPTGKAARRMSEACFGRPARTIHRLLEYSPDMGGFQRGPNYPLSEDLVIIDEASMIDAPLMASLMAAIKPEAKLILVGDKDQLPSVGPGNVLADVIASESIPVAELTRVHRQSEHSWISVNAQKINRGEPLVLDPETEDFFVLLTDTPEDARRNILELICEILPKEYGFDPFRSIQLLCPQKRGTLGVWELNEELQGLLNPDAPGKKTFRGFRTFDKVIHLKNNYQIEVMNGETGQIVDITGELVTVDFGDREVEYEPEDLEHLGLAYAMTIHKSQGSEWPCVVVPIHSHHFYMLSRNLAYTAVTRGKSLVYIVGNKRGLDRAIRNNQAKQRHTSLAWRLRQAFGQEAA